MYIKLYVISVMSILKLVAIPQKETRQGNIKKFLLYQLYNLPLYSISADAKLLSECSIEGLEREYQKYNVQLEI